MQLDYPFQFDGRGRTAGTTDDDHIRDLIEQVLFTAPGERVNRLTFGSGVMHRCSPRTATRWPWPRSTSQGALQQWLGDLIQVQAVDAE
jgi:phage baseplate assembly protein W